MSRTDRVKVLGGGPSWMVFGEFGGPIVRRDGGPEGRINSNNNGVSSEL